MAVYKIKDLENPDDAGVLVKAQNDAQAVRKVTQGRFSVENLNTDQVAEAVEAGVKFFKEKEATNADAP